MAAIVPPAALAPYRLHPLDTDRCVRRRLWWDAVVDLIFVMDMIFSLHTAYYKSVGPGKYILIDDLIHIRKNYLASLGFVCDFLGIVPLKEVKFPHLLCASFSAKPP